MKKNILITLVILIFFGCSSKLAEFTIISTKNFDSQKGLIEIGKVSGSDNASIICIFPTGKISMENAVDRAIEGAPNCCAISNAKFHQYFWYIPYIYGQGGIVVEGTALKEKK